MTNIELKFDLQGLKDAFTLGRGLANGNTINMMSACAPVELEKAGWIEKTAGRFETFYKPTTKLNETAG